MKNEIRSNYIKSLLEDKEKLKAKLEETTTSCIKEILGETVNESLNKLISEADEDSYEVEEVDTPEDAENADGEEVNPEDEKLEDDLGDADTIDSGVDTSGEGTDDDKMWKDLEQYKDADGDYDLTGMDTDGVIKVLKSMGPEDGVRVVKNDDGTITLNDDETEKEYIIDINEINEALGYTDDYQKETAMTTPNNDEPANPANTYSVDKGVPTGVKKPYPGNSGNMDPFGEEVNETEGCSGDDCILEIELDDDVDEATNVGGFVQQNTTSKSHVPNSDGRRARNQSKGGEYTGTQVPRYSNEEINRIKQKANAIFMENKELKAVIPELKSKIEESIVINYNIGKAVKLMTENTTTRDEKKTIIQKLSTARTINEANEVYKKLDAELKSTHKMDNLSNVSGSQLAESRTNIVETPMYQSDDLSETLSLMSRMENLYKKQ